MIPSFKFQSDSINTALRLNSPGNLIPFKFQSDSINTGVPIKKVDIANQTLNSNLILLIPGAEAVAPISELTLNSNLILLIL